MTDGKPVVGVSACLLGENVRYDGGHKAHHTIIEQLGGSLELRPLCPEVAGGMGIPRPPANLVEEQGSLRVLGAEDSTLDVTEAFQTGAGRIIEQCPIDLCAYIVKARSPSCGSGSTPIYQKDGTVARTGDGILVQRLRRWRPGLLIVDESYFDQAGAARRFIDQCRLIHAELIEK